MTVLVALVRVAVRVLFPAAKSEDGRVKAWVVSGRVAPLSCQATAQLESLGLTLKVVWVVPTEETLGVEDTGENELREQLLRTLTVQEHVTESVPSLTTAEIVLLPA